MKQHYTTKCYFADLKFACVSILLIFVILGFQRVLAEVPPLIPSPQKVEWNNQKFVAQGSITLISGLKSDPIIIRQVCETLASQGAKIKITGNNEIVKGKKIIIRTVKKIPEIMGHVDEGYKLLVLNDSIVVEAITEKGLFHAIQTLKQLLASTKGQSFFAGCTITDWPAFAFRGFMQDVGRNYMSIPLLKEQIEVMSAYKFNVFHFHVTDNPAWRLESRKYPQLKEAYTMSRWPGKFYSQQEFVDLVNFCNERQITLIPELDIPGHCEAFRKALSIDSMSDVRVKTILLDLIDELCNLVPKEKMPILHLGTDEVWRKNEVPAKGLLEALIERVKFHQREVIVWRPGQAISNDMTSITQLWSSKGAPKEGHRYLDSRLNYLNHLDPFAGISQLYFDRISNASQGDSLRLGGILCCWNDNNIKDEIDILRQNPVYPGMLTYSETTWKGQDVDFGDKFLAKLPLSNDLSFNLFQNFEEKLIKHRDQYFQGKPFPYVKQTSIEWKLLGPFEITDDVPIFPEKGTIEQEYQVKGKSYHWQGPFNGATIHINHFFGYPSYFIEKKGIVYATTKIWSPQDQTVGCWIGFHDWSRSGGRRGGPFPEQGKWHNTDPKVWLNGNLIEPPVWDHPGMAERSEDIPFTDENYFFREPSKIALKKGWNQVLLKVPQYAPSWKWMFTFVPVKVTNGNVSEVEGLMFKAE